MSPEAGSHLLIVNPSAGGGRAREILPEIDRELSARGIAAETVMTTSLEHGCAQALAAVAEGRTVVVVSGDGLIGQIGGALAGSSGVMGVIPGGRGNDFARVMDIPVDVPEAVELIATRPVREIDVGVVNGHRYLCVASCGFDSDANRIANETTLVKGNLVYLYAALRALWSWKPAAFTVTVDDRVERFSGYSVAVANSKAYGGGMFIAPEALLDDGEVDVVVSRDSSKLSFLRAMPSLFKGEHLDRDEVSAFRGASVRIEADRSFAVFADGDHVTDLPADVSVMERSLSVIAPAQ